MGSVLTILPDGKIENRNELWLIRQLIKTVFLSEQRKHGLLAVCECVRFAQNVVDVGICTQCLVLLLLPGSASAA